MKTSKPNQPKKKYQWNGMYTLVIVVNLIYIITFYMISNYYNNL